MVYVYSIVKIWNASTSKLLYYLPGHKGSVNEVFHRDSFISLDVYSLYMFYVVLFAITIYITMHDSYTIHVSYIYIYT